jgi:hypothetical protein
MSRAATVRQVPAVDLDAYRRLDLHEALEGNRRAPTPDLVSRTDGECLFYRGYLHSISGEPESAKSWLAVVAVADAIEAGLDAVYFDWEDSVAGIVGRLVAMGVDPHLILEHLHYLQPPGPITDDVLAMYALEELAGAVVVVIDAMTEAQVADGIDPDRNAEVAEWLGRLPRLALEAGAAVLLIDHVTKSRESRGRYAVGAGHKLAAVHVAYSLRVLEPVAPGRVGRVLLVVSKDRPGGVRRFAEGGKDAAEMIVDATGERVAVRFEPPSGTGWAPTARMAEIMRVLVVDPTPRTANGIYRLVGGKRSTTLDAIKALLGCGDLVADDQQRLTPRADYGGAES